MPESFKKVSNPLTVIAIFAGITEVGGTAVLPFLNDANQSTYLIFLIVFPGLLVILFFLTLNFNNKVLYAPSDFQDESNFVNILENQFNKMEEKVSQQIEEKVTNLETSLSSNELLSRARASLKAGQYDDALEEVNRALEIKTTGSALIIKAMIAGRRQDYAEAIEICFKGLELENTASVMATLYWNRACYGSLARLDASKIISDLENAITYKISLVAKLQSDADLENIRDSVEFKKFSSKLQG